MSPDFLFDKFSFHIMTFQHMCIQRLMVTICQSNTLFHQSMWSKIHFIKWETFVYTPGTPYVPQLPTPQLTIPICVEYVI